MSPARACLTAAIIIGLAAVCFAPPGHAATAGGAYYARIIIPQAAHRPPQTTVYVQFHGAQMRLATSVAALAKAKPVAARSRSNQGRVARFPEVTLPVPARALPPGCSKVSANLSFFSLYDSGAETGRRTEMLAFVGLWCRDAQGTSWTYSARETAAAARVPDEAKAVLAPDLAKLKVAVAAKAQREQLSIVVQLMAGKVALYDIIRDGKPVDAASVTVRNSRGSVVASKRGPLTAFGFG